MRKNRCHFKFHNSGNVILFNLFNDVFSTAYFVGLDDHERRIVKEAAMSILRCTPRIYFVKLRKTTITLTQDSRLPGCDSFSGPQKYEAGLSTSQDVPEMCILNFVLRNVRPPSCDC